MANSTESDGTILHISRRAAGRIRQGHLWLYRSEIDRTTGSEDDTGLATLLDPGGNPLGTGLLSTSSEIAARVVPPRPHLPRTEYLADLRVRLQAALEH